MSTQSTIISTAEPLNPIGKLGRIGLVALATDFNIEKDLRRMLPDEVELYANRVENANPVTIENLRAMAPDIGRAARGIIPEARLDALIYGCTSGTVAIGEEKTIELMQAGRGDIPSTTPVTAAVAALTAFQAKRISILTPYTESVNQSVANYFESKDFEVINIVGFGLDSDEDITSVTPESVFQAASAVCDSSADLLFVSCTGLRAAPVVERIEAAIHKPVVSSNQALAWHCLELIGQPYQVTGYGRLFQNAIL